MPNNVKYDLEERTARFGADVINFVKQLPAGPVNSPLINQLVRSATSVGANYCEADDAQSKMDFIHKLSICKKEARETTHWFKMIKTAEPASVELADRLSKEATELNLIFNAIINSTKKNISH